MAQGGGDPLVRGARLGRALPVFPSGHVEGKGLRWPWRAPDRRGKPSALAVYGLGNTLVAGDFLFCRAFALCARFEAQGIRWAEISSENEVVEVEVTALQFD